MINCYKWPISVCTWSLKNNVSELNLIKEKTGVCCVHLDLKPIVENSDNEYINLFQKDSWKITSTMVGFPQEDYSTLETIKKTGGIMLNENWEENKKSVLKAIDLTKKLGAEYLSFHFGFLDFSNQSYMNEFKDKVKLLADYAGENGITILMESGQETASELSGFLTEMNHKALGVNFDPANMILYGKGKPLEAIEVLIPWVKHVHIKDAIGSPVAGQWGKEVVWGSGQVESDKFLGKLKDLNYNGALAIERECGQNRMIDIENTITKLKATSNNSKN
ncbi:MAG: xylose isomerase [Planctomycetes bacterium GWF2_42_9]|nr:MAG: xylose isomerase [Planctomycetes bacterium GWF2_42_9]HAL44327.1 xylose isomerase [Phycisphaerales bacterium]